MIQSNENENYENEINLNGIIMEEEIMKGLENNSSLQKKNNVVETNVKERMHMHDTRKNLAICNHSLCDYGFWSSFQLIATMTYFIFPID